MQAIAEALSSVTLGAPAQFRNVTVIPLLAPEERAPPATSCSTTPSRASSRT